VAQTLAKTAKALPVVLWGTLFGGKRYSARQYAHAILITGGCSIFVLGGDITSGSAIRDASWRSYAAGCLLLLTYLAADGWTSTQQEVRTSCWLCVGACGPPVTAVWKHVEGLAIDH
jgi:adenosine 3'-phospho 5'-phosphosulfate transporter B2